jgi:hypothetical protein
MFVYDVGKNPTFIFSINIASYPSSICQKYHPVAKELPQYICQNKKKSMNICVKINI